MKQKTKRFHHWRFIHAMTAAALLASCSATRNGSLPKEAHVSKKASFKQDFATTTLEPVSIGLQTGSNVVMAAGTVPMLALINVMLVMSGLPPHIPDDFSRDLFKDPRP
ncbi:MAG TPA: hypothetical protein VLE43_08975 [Candidatus Saccharimonadia bacterium]|nr:hypothetical protein [Candidatus Saccharimonadia bacterium]